MPSPNFAKASTYGAMYSDNTQYTNATITTSPAGYPWSFAAGGIPPVANQFTNPNALSGTPALLRMTLNGFGSQGATTDALTIAASIMGVPVTLAVFPTTAFTASANFNVKVVADISVLNTSTLLVETCAFAGPTPIQFSNLTAGFFLSQTQLEAGGIIQFTSAWNAVTTAPSFTSGFNYIEIFAP